MNESLRPEIFTDLTLHVTTILQEATGMDNDAAEQIAVAVANKMMRIWGGQSVYFPKGIIYLTSTRDYKIWQECNGRNYPELAKKYNLTLQWIYKVVKKVQKAESARRQLSLLSTTDEPQE